MGLGLLFGVNEVLIGKVTQGHICEARNQKVA